MAVAFILSSCLAASADAALSKKYREWREGPEQWIMNAEEKRAWRNVKSDEEAIRFIDLFWVRRDPTVGTPKNEFREEFANRVLYADKNYEERLKRGALTDRGRVLIVLGDPTTGGRDLAHSTHHALGGNVNNPGGGGRMRGGRDIWTWEHDDAQKFDMPKIEVVFVEDPGTGKTRRDLMRQDYPGAEAAAIRKAVVNPDLNEVPDWALRGGIEPTFTVTVPMPAPVPREARAGAPDPVPAPVSKAPAPAPAAQLPLAARGVTAFTLLRDVNDLDADAKISPFRTLKEIRTFKAGDELGWVTQYCAGTTDDPTLRFTLRVTGLINGEVIDRAAPPDEMIPDRLRAADGCYMLRGAVILEGLEPGDYQLTLTVEDTAVAGAYTQTRDFTIE